MLVYLGYLDKLKASVFLRGSMFSRLSDTFVKFSTSLPVFQLSIVPPLTIFVGKSFLLPSPYPKNKLINRGIFISSFNYGCHRCVMFPCSCGFGTTCCFGTLTYANNFTVNFFGFSGGDHQNQISASWNAGKNLCSIKFVNIKNKVSLWEILTVICDQFRSRLVFC